MKKKHKNELMYIIVNKNGEAYAGLSAGYPQWSHNWASAKMLNQENTTFICDSNPTEYELIREDEL